MVLKTTAIKNFLTASTWPDLAELYTPEMEVQILVEQMNGERVEGEYQGKSWQGYTDGIQTWKSFRIPWNAASEPAYKDSEMKFNLSKYALGIGMTGWDWYNKQSQWVAFDFDSITSHGAGLSATELAEVEKQAYSVPWLTIRKSTSGNGLHVYVFLDPFISTANHNEHAALARSILGTMAALTGFDFNTKVDICGGNLWCWHKKMLPSGGEGLKLIHRGYNLHDVSPNWRDHVAVVKGSKKKVKPNFDKLGNSTDLDTTEDAFDTLTSSSIKIKLDVNHIKLIKYLQENNLPADWQQDNNLLVTHTSALKRAHIELCLKGIFETIAVGKEQGDINCFCFPMRGGGWSIRRFTPGVREHETWEQDSSGWTKTYFNLVPSLPIAARSAEGIEAPSGGYSFRTAEQAAKAAALVGIDLELPNFVLSRRTQLKTHKDGRLVVEMTREKEDDHRKLNNWLEDKTLWKRIFNVQLPTVKEADGCNYDDLIRHVVNSQNIDIGWLIKSDDVWVDEPLTHVKYVLKSMALKDSDLNNVIGGNILRKWVLVNYPFQPEYLGNRQWNRHACQLLFVPSTGDTLHYPTWKKILTHVGKSLDASILTNDWCKTNNITSGYEYLKIWVASLFQKPSEPLPYLFLHGPEASGKSIFHEALALLISPSGYKRADQALLSQGGFNGELDNAILCIIEERNLEKNRMAYNRVKDWVTSPQMPIHCKGGTPYLVENTSHWIQCSNERPSCPVFPGDTRITMIYVSELDKSEWESKHDIFTKLKKEAPDFLGSIMSLEIPVSNDRLNVPIINTEDKKALQQDNMSVLDQFIEQNCHRVLGKSIKFSEFYEKFIESIEATEAYNWSKIAVGKALPQRFVKGRRREDSQFAIGNISWLPKQEGEIELPELIVINDMLHSKN